MRFLMIGCTLFLMFSFTACSGSSNDSSSSGDGGASVAAGETLFNEKLIGTQPGCVTCHSLEKGVKLVGPSLAGIGSRAGTIVEGQSADEYLRKAIVEPDDYVTEGFTAGQMPAVIAKDLNTAEVESLVLYLLTLQ